MNKQIKMAKFYSITIDCNNDFISERAYEYSWNKIEGR